ncbi:hypothetical protein Dimus_038427 [Dionaea muscipula]
MMTSDEDKEEVVHNAQYMDLVLYQGPVQQEGASKSIPFFTEPSTSTPTHAAQITDTKIHAHINEAVRVMLMSMEEQNKAIKELLKFFELNQLRDRNLQASICLSIQNLSKDMNKNTKDVDLLIRVLRDDYPKKNKESTECIEAK